MLAAMDWLNFHHLRYFWTVAKEGSVKAAASKLHVSQPSVSEQIRELEHALGNSSSVAKVAVSRLPMLGASLSDMRRIFLPSAASS